MKSSINKGRKQMKSSKKALSTKKLTEAQKRLARAEKDRTRRANKKFAALSAVDKRLTIARDVLAQLDAKRFVASNNTFLSTSKNAYGGYDQFFKTSKNVPNAEMELCSVLKKTSSCNVCVVGSLFVCAVEKADKLKISQLYGFKEHQKDVEHGYNDGLGVGPEDVFQYLSSFFTPNQIALMELAFESGDGCVDDYDVKFGKVKCSLDREEYDNAKDFCYDLLDADTKLRLVMENLIVNKGVFRPEIKPVEKTVYVMAGFIK